MNIVDVVFFRGGKLCVVHSRIISGSGKWLFGVLRMLHSQVLTCGFLSRTGMRIGSLHGASACLRAMLDVHGISLFASEMVTRWTDEKTVAPEDSPLSGLLNEHGDVEIICIMIFLRDCYRSSS